jgi:hypothetical protein
MPITNRLSLRMMLPKLSRACIRYIPQPTLGPKTIDVMIVSEEKNIVAQKQKVKLSKLCERSAVPEHCFPPLISPWPSHTVF